MLEPNVLLLGNSCQPENDGADRIVINHEATHLDAIADVIIRDDVPSALPQIADVLEAV